MTEKKLTRSEIKRAAIIDAAKKAFKAHGVKDTSMDKLAEMAQVSKRTVYNHFATKEALVTHLMSELWSQAMVIEDFHYKPEEPLFDQLKLLLQIEVELMSSQEYIDLARVAIGYFFYKPEALQQEIAKFNKQETSLFKWLTAAVTDKRLSCEDVIQANTQLHSLIKGECFWPQVTMMQPPVSKDYAQQQVEQTCQMFLARYQV